MLLLLGVGLPLLAVEELAIAIFQSGGFLWDEPLLLAVHSVTNARLDRFAKIFTKFGVYLGVFPASVALSLLLLQLRKWRSLLYFNAVMIGSMILNRTAKAYWHRSRPSLWEWPVSEIDFSFPSGHAMSSMSFVAALLILTWGSRWFGLTLAAGSVFVVSIAWTRLYLGVHFPSDILAGWLVSIAWAIGLCALIRPHLVAPAASETELTTQEEESIATQ
ncbi:phosphatase PAP2 family protein [Microcoleus sp. FACHB-1515]|uniref:phosphatase PAP2 family protein n=1 Tax=Cyanophyceae TaxID=3028117 RepID=UPI001F549B94|nr:phosphatase PAP2 family protein [Microcoleus sp. FACHB-1515]